MTNYIEVGIHFASAYWFYITNLCSDVAHLRL